VLIGIEKAHLFGFSATGTVVWAQFDLEATSCWELMRIKLKLCNFLVL
jgi:hypothetical protein